MKITNKHTRIIEKPISDVSVLLNSLSSNDDQLWPHENWAPIKLDRELSEGATGGHGPIKYVITEFKPGRKINFRFIEPSNFQGNHWFELIEKGENKTEISHTIKMNVAATAIIPWLIMIRPTHDALIEDSFDKVQLKLGLTFQRKKWSFWVRLLKKTIMKKPA
ncbi:hypothetical protein DENIS_3706 [Desulfonema ishimotonii]|uniref:SRPBCC family protein n=2 Tax=Desulfonema ishimotonii TaxID=45657 RepID=A0A401G0H6_9BACT|nr:hypothetical protein DENIS_3706 [Desulfonema ishimotonii]